MLHRFVRTRTRLSVVIVAVTIIRPYTLHYCCRRQNTLKNAYDNLATFTVHVPFELRDRCRDRFVLQVVFAADGDDQVSAGLQATPGIEAVREPEFCRSVL